MQKILFFFVTCLFPFLTIIAQVKFEKGYFINNSDYKIDCFIKNADWKNNPTEFYYRESENSEISEGSIETVKEFGVDDQFKYKRFVVDIDRSSDLTKYVSNEKQPIFKKEKLFLKVLLEGDATLYSYEGINLKRYFFSFEDKPIEQLVYKKYQVSQNRFGKNNYFRQQLSNNLKCPSITKRQFEHIKYQQKELINIFNEYNNCGSNNYTKYTEKKVDKFNLSIRPGINSSSLSIDNTFYSSFQSIKFDSNLNFRIGIEAEYILPFNKNKWAIIIEPSYNYYNSEYPDNYSNKTAELKLIDIPIGIRHFFFINKDSKLFVNSSFLTGFGFNSKIDFLDAAGIRNNMVFGVGYRYKKLSFELKYDTPSNVFDNYVYWVSDYQRASFVVGYNLF